MQMSIPNPYSLIGPNSTILIGWNKAILIEGKDANDDIVVQLLLDRGILSPTGQILIIGTLLQGQRREWEHSVGGLAA